jgi:uncharacterized protein
MNEAAPSRQLAAAAPVSPTDRVWVIDAMRGLALFGVLAVNLDALFRVTFFEWFLPRSPGSRLDQIASGFLSFGLEFKAISLFSLLFGVGLAIQYERLAQNPRRTVLLLRRLTALLAFGLIHLFLIWNGDILTAYAIAGLVAVPLLLFLPRSILLGASALLMLLWVAIPWVLPFALPNLPAAWLTDHVAEARLVYGSGTFLEILRFRIAEVPAVSMFTLVNFFPRTLGLILFGIWLWQSGAIRQLGEHSFALAAAGAAMIGIGLLLTAQEKGYLVLLQVGAIAPFWKHFAWAAMSDLAPIIVALGYAALILVASGSARLRKVLQFAVPVGRMAFTNYITQSVVLGLLFYGYGFALLGRVGAAGGLAIAVGIYAAQALVSAWWLRRFRFGPLEWLWRTLMYGKRQPWLTIR